jgi:hypothetical protein
MVSNVATLLANCTIGFYNVSVAYQDGAYSLENETLTNTNMSFGLAIPSITNVYAMRLLNNVEGIARSSNSSDQVLALLQQELGRLALAASYSVVNIPANTTSQWNTRQLLLGRYPMAPALALVGILYLYSLFALLLALDATFTSVRNMHVAARGRRAVSTLELAQRRLTDPAAVVSALFPAEDTETRAANSVSTATPDMFQERTGERSERLRVGFRISANESEFGLWKER